MSPHHENQFPLQLVPSDNLILHQPPSPKNASGASMFLVLKGPTRIGQAVFISTRTAQPDNPVVASSVLTEQAGK